MELAQLAGWFLAMMLSAEFARKKNKNVVYAILLSFLFGYFALMFYMLCAKKPDQ